MALTEATRDVKGKTLTFIQTNTGVGINKAGLSAFDLEVLNEVDTNGVGATLQAKMEAYTLSNGRNAWDVYGKNAYNMDNYAAVALQKAVSGTKTSDTLATHDTSITDHEARITALEP